MAQGDASEGSRHLVGVGKEAPGADASHAADTAAARGCRWIAVESLKKLTSLTPGTGSTVRAAWFPT